MFPVILCLPLLITLGAWSVTPTRHSLGDTVTQYFTHVGPAADAAALVETIELGGDGHAGSTLDYLGKGRIIRLGTWRETGNTVTLVLTRSNGAAINDTVIFTRSADSLVVTRGEVRSVYPKTAKKVIDLIGVYNANRRSVDQQERLVALTLLPNGTARLAIEKAGATMMTELHWTTRQDPNTKVGMVVVSTGDRGGDRIFELQVAGQRLRGTTYDKRKWGTDLTFVKWLPQNR